MNNQTKQPYIPCNLSRRTMLFKAGGGFGALALAFMQAQEAEADRRVVALYAIPRRRQFKKAR